MSQAEKEWLFLSSGPGDASFNMALDEALLEAMPRLNRPVLRSYAWRGPAASFGYFQKYSEVQRLTPLRPLVRRPTGGGIVPHAGDWTYAAAFPTHHEWYSLTAIESYRRIHGWICSAFARLGFETELSPAARQVQPGQCFAGCERFDLLWGGQKIAGAAQRRRRDGLLIQGSIQPPPPFPPRTRWEDAMRETGRAEFGIGWQEVALDGPLESRAEELAGGKYSQPAYNQKR